MQNKTFFTINAHLLQINQYKFFINVSMLKPFKTIFQITFLLLLFSINIIQLKSNITYIRDDWHQNYSNDNKFFNVHIKIYSFHYFVHWLWNDPGVLCNHLNRSNYTNSNNKQKNHMKNNLLPPEIIHDRLYINLSNVHVIAIYKEKISTYEQIRDMQTFIEVIKILAFLSPITKIHIIYFYWVVRKIISSFFSQQWT